MKNDKFEDVNEFQIERYHRVPVPKTIALQASIIERAKLTHQGAAPTPTNEVTAQKGFKAFILRLPPLFRSAAIASVACVMIGAVFFIGRYDSSLAPDRFSENDLEWQELMLMEDELLFAQL